MRPLAPIALAAVAALACDRPVLRVQAAAGVTLVDVQTVGDPSSAPVRVRLRCAGATVWELEATAPGARTQRFPLQAGDNPCLPGGLVRGGWRVVAPEGCAAGFRIPPGAACEVQVENARAGGAPASAPVRFP